MILVTGGNGFVGAAVLAAIAERGQPARAAVRRAPCFPGSHTEYALGLDLASDTDWTKALTGIHTLIHTAARVHVMRDSGPDTIAEYRRTNVDGTLRIARQAADNGVRRFVFISSIKVNGERTTAGRPFRASDVPAPIDPYGTSKHEAESALREVAAETGLEVVVIRPVLVYGPGVKANFASMMQWLTRGLPLPLGAIHNTRSLVALENLVDLILTCVDHPAAAGETFLISDGEDLSTTELLRRLSCALGVSPWLLPVPEAFLKFGARVAGRRDMGRRLFESLQVDIAHTTHVLGWTPPVSVDQGLRITAESFLRRERNR